MKLLKTIAIALTIVTASSCKDKISKKTSENDSETSIKTKINKNMNVLFVLTSHDKLGDTGKKQDFG